MSQVGEKLSFKSSSTQTHFKLSHYHHQRQHDSTTQASWIMSSSRHYVSSSRNVEAVSRPHLSPFNWLMRSSTVDYYLIPVRQSGSSTKETKDDYCRGKDRYYEQLADDMVQGKKDRDGFKALMSSARDLRDYRKWKWKREYERLYEKVEMLKRMVEDEQRRVLRRYPQ
ncbi:uncharacterized protein LTR77_007616 [Saxophila tyrrhenica]|uniref:Uncharacterized protein n=1 Tax=Saxophila tyrrhenica TaxID=1690608 RepID=A0AAV9P5Y6_9PEZI|nr:hypothetical protein LTR77_007616 [Saxophila tyrrhenica]